MEVKAPSYWYKNTGQITVFLSGSIEMGSAIPWQEALVQEMDNPNILFLNPRREDWDETWKQNIENEQFYEQVSWELNGLQLCDIAVVVFDPNTKSPITLMELGLLVGMNKLILVYCPEGFWRKGNVDIICKEFGYEASVSMEDLYKKLTVLIGHVRWLNRI